MILYLIRRMFLEKDDGEDLFKTRRAFFHTLFSQGRRAMNKTFLLDTYDWGQRHAYESCFCGKGWQW
jgi:hypothetical protein